MTARTTLPGPRSRYPGQLILALRTDTLAFLERTVAQYGDFCQFDIGPRQYFLLNDPNLIREVLVTHADAFTKGPALRGAKATLGEGLLTSEGDLHRRQRRLMQPSLHPASVATYAEDMVRYTEQMRGRWRDGQQLDLHEEMMQLTLAVVAKTLFGAELEHETREIGQAMTVNVQMFNRALMPFGKLLNYLPLPSNFRFAAAQKRLRSTIDRFIEDKHRQQQQAQPRKDLLSVLLAARDSEGNGAGMSDQQLRDEAITLFTAGHETTANGIAFTWYLLAKHPEAFALVHEEVDRVLAGRLPTIGDVEQLRYVRAAFAESMRIFPPAWAIGRQAHRAVRIGDVEIPIGGVILVSQYLTHRDPRWWPDPLRFDPGRWLRDDATSRPRYAYYPFGSGPRSCIGEAFAWMEGVLILATISQHWRMTLQPGFQMSLRPSITLRPKHGLPITVHRR